LGRARYRANPEPDLRPHIEGLVLAHHQGMATAQMCRKKCCAINVIVSGNAGFSPYSQGHDRSK
jgi:hypothetical protein